MKDMTILYKGIYPLAVWLRKKLSDDENGNRHTIISHLLSVFYSARC